MNDSELQPLPQSDLAVQFAALQRQVSVLVTALLVVSVTLAGYLAYQDHISHKDIGTIQPQAMPVIKAFDAANAGINRQAITNFLAQISAYGQKNPDFATAGVEEIRFSAGAGRSHAAQTRDHHARSTEEIDGYDTFTPQFGQ